MTPAPPAGGPARWLRDGGRGLLLAAILVIATNLIVLTGVGLNRRGEPDASLTLTERELHLGYADSENTGLALEMEWNGGGWGAGPEWLDRGRLEELGFDCSKPLDDEDAGLWYDKALPLQRYAVLEYGGASWQGWLDDSARELDELRAEVERGRETARTLRSRQKLIAAKRRGMSRIFLIDTGSDAAALRERYPDRARFLIAPAIVHLHYRKDWNSETKSYGDPYLRGGVSEILVDALHVPRRLRQVPDAVRDEERRAAEARRETEPESTSWELERYHPPRYRVEVRYGRRHEPWIAAIGPIADHASGSGPAASDTQNPAP